jgi:hypothetical protein
MKLIGIIIVTGLFLSATACKSRGKNNDYETVKYRQDKVSRLDNYLTGQIGGTATSIGDTVFISMLRDDLPSLDESRCITAQLNLNDGTFRRVYFIAADVMGHPLKRSDGLDLPSAGPLPANCDIPPSPIS